MSNQDPFWIGPSLHSNFEPSFDLNKKFCKEEAANYHGEEVDQNKWISRNFQNIEEETTVIEKKMLSLKRPFTGIKPKDIHMVVGKTAKTDISKSESIKWEMLKE